MKIRWDRFGGQLGVGIAVAGLVLVFLGWNGAASLDRVQGQFPYLISGGVAGLCLVVIGAALMVIQSQREDRARIEGLLEDVRAGLERLGSGSLNGGPDHVADADAVVAGPTTYHRPSCLLVEGRSLPQMSRAAATERGLDPCRTCGAADDTAGLAPRAKRVKR